MLGTLTTALLLTLSLPNAGTSEVKVRTLDGEKLTGKLAGLSDNAVVVTSDGRERSFESSSLHSLGLHESAAKSRSKIEIALRDGSLVQASEYVSTKTEATITLADGTSRKLPIPQIASVRLREQSNDVAKQWAEYAREPAKADRLIVRRKAAADDGTLSESLDANEGLVGAVTPTTVEFESEGDTLRVKRERVDGILFARGSANRDTSARCYVWDIDGSRWAAKSLQLEGSAIAIVTPSNVSLQLPLDRVRRIDYAAGNIQYLSDLPAERTVRESWLAESNERNSFLPLSGRTPEGPVSIGGNPHSQSIWMPAKSSLTVSVPEGHARLQMKVGIDDRVNATDGARLIVEADGKVLFDQLVERSPTPLPIVLDLHEARRLRVTVDFGGTSFLGDQLVLCEAMFTR